MASPTSAAGDGRIQSLSGNVQRDFQKTDARARIIGPDSTDPQCIQSIRAENRSGRTLFCVSSKSGTTLSQPNLLLQYFFEETRKVVGERAGHHFIAITDPDSNLEGIAVKLGFRRVYHGVPGIGGRYSALSDFGLVPHAAMGLDTEEFLKRTMLMVDLCQSKSAEENPGVALGLILGAAAARRHRDKVTLLCSHTVYDLGAWLEQLLAESTGKEGRGLIPVDREPIPKENLEHVYGRDRVFAYIKFAGDRDTEMEDAIAALEIAKQPVIRIVLPDLRDLGQILFQWEIATAVVGSIIGINPFNQPDVEASKIVTRDLTSMFEESGSLPSEEPLLEQDGIQLFTNKANVQMLLRGGKTLGAAIREHLDRLRTSDYFGLLAYLPMFPEYKGKLQRIRRHVPSKPNTLRPC